MLLANVEETDHVRNLTKAAACAIAIGAIAITASGCGSANTSANAPTVQNSAVQTNAQGQTISTPSASASTGGAAAAGCGKPVCSTTLKLETDPINLAFAVTSLSAPAGKVTIVMTNMSPIQHNIAIDVPGAVQGKIVSKGGVSTATATLKAGTYQYYCAVPGHRAAGMQGTLTVS